jgi:DNA polymerase V
MLYKEFGKNAVFLIDQAWGYEPVDIASIKAYKPESTSTSAGQVLSRPYTFDETQIIVTEMIDKLVLEIVEKNLKTDQIVLTVGYDIENITDGWRRSEYKGEITTDRYGRQIPKHARGTANMGKYTSSTKLITEKTLELFDRIVDKKLLTRRLNITANRLLTEEEAKATAAMEQLSLFDDPQEIAQKDADEAREERKQKAILAIKNRFGANAIMKGTSYQDAATGIERNKTVGGHHE